MPRKGLRHCTVWCNLRFMQLKQLFDDLTKEQREQLASACAHSVGHLRNVAAGYKECSLLLAARLEKNTRAMFGKHRTVQRLDLIPTETVAEIWPELAAKRRKTAKA